MEVDDKVEEQVTDRMAQLQDEQIQAAVSERQPMQMPDEVKDDVNWLQMQFNQEAEQSSSLNKEVENLSREREMRQRESESYFMLTIKGPLRFFISSLLVDPYKQFLQATDHLPLFEWPFSQVNLD